MDQKRKNPDNPPANSPLPNATMTTVSPSVAEDTASLSAQLACIKKLYGALLTTFSVQVDNRIRSVADHVQDQVRREQAEQLKNIKQRLEREQTEKIQTKFGFYLNDLVAELRLEKEHETHEIVQIEAGVRANALRITLEEDCHRRILANEAAAAEQQALLEAKLTIMEETELQKEIARHTVTIKERNSLITKCETLQSSFNALEAQIEDYNKTIQDEQQKARAATTELAKCTKQEETNTKTIATLEEDLRVATEKIDTLEEAAVQHTITLKLTIRQRDAFRADVELVKADALRDLTTYQIASTTHEALKKREAAFTAGIDAQKAHADAMTVLQNDNNCLNDLYEAMCNQLAILRREMPRFDLNPHAYNDPDSGNATPVDNGLDGLDSAYNSPPSSAPSSPMVSGDTSAASTRPPSPDSPAAAAPPAPAPPASKTTLTVTAYLPGPTIYVDRVEKLSHNPFYCWFSVERYSLILASAAMRGVLEYFHNLINVSNRAPLSPPHSPIYAPPPPPYTSPQVPTPPPAAVLPPPCLATPPTLSFFRQLWHELINTLLPSTSDEYSIMGWSLLFLLIHFTLYYLMYYVYTVYLEGNVWILGNEDTRLAVLDGLFARQAGVGQGWAHFMMSESWAQRWEASLFFILGGGEEKTWQMAG